MGQFWRAPKETRVTLDLEEIAQAFPSLPLADVYQVIGYYLKRSAELVGYFEDREREERELLDAHQDEWSPKRLRGYWPAERIREVRTASLKKCSQM